MCANTFWMMVVKDRTTKAEGWQLRLDGFQGMKGYSNPAKGRRLDILKRKKKYNHLCALIQMRWKGQFNLVLGVSEL